MSTELESENKMNSPEYQKYLKEKNKIKKKYTPGIENICGGDGKHSPKLIYTRDTETYKEWVRYRNDILTLCLKPNGLYQKWMWSLEKETNMIRKLKNKI